MMIISGTQYSICCSASTKPFVFEVYSKKWSVVTVSGSSGREDIGKSVANCKSNEVGSVETGKNRYRFKDVSD